VALQTHWTFPVARRLSWRQCQQHINEFVSHIRVSA